MNPVLGVKRVLRRGLRRLGYDLVRYPGGRCDALWPAWVDLLRQGGEIQTVFDVGANRGQTIAWFRPLFPQAQIHAFEPFAPAFSELCAVAKGDPKVKPVRLALGERSGSATLHQNSHDTTNSLLVNAPDARLHTPPHMCIPSGESTVPLERLDHYCSAAGIDRIDVLKIDAQGYERHILSGAGEMLRPSIIRGLFLEVMFVDYYQGQSWCGELLELLRGRGYRLFGLAGVSFDVRQGWRWADAMFIGN